MLRLPTPPLAWILACLLAGACVHVPKPDTEVRGAARRALEQGDWNRAMDLWNQVLTGQRGVDTEARLGLGRALVEAGRGSGAVQVLRPRERAVELGEQHSLWLAKAYLLQGQVRAAGAVLSDLLVANPAHREALLLYGRSLLGSDREAKGLGLLLSALRLDPSNGALAEDVALRATALGLAHIEGEAWALRIQADEAPAEAYLGAALWETQRDAAGASASDSKPLLWLRQAVRLDPQSAPAWTHLASLLDAQGQTLEARQAYRKAVEADPSDWPACLYLAQAHVSLGNCVQAQLWIDHALGHMPEQHPQRAAFEELKRTCEGR